MESHGRLFISSPSRIFSPILSDEITLKNKVDNLEILTCPESLRLNLKDQKFTIYKAFNLLLIQILKTDFFLVF